MVIDMKLKTSDLRNERQWRAATGLTEKKFYILLGLFKQSYIEIYSAPLQDRLVKNNIDYCIENEEDLLLFTLLSLKSGLTYDVLGIMVGMDGSNAHKNQRKGVCVLSHALRKAGCEPRREFSNPDDFIAFCSGHDIDKIIIDCTEQMIQRPSDNETQRDHFSGKKHFHSLKSLVFSLPDTRICYLGNAHIGKKHDYRVLKESFSPEHPWFSDITVETDLGFIGIGSDYELKKLLIPHKKPRKSELTDEQKTENNLISSDRITVEHSIRGIKRYRILSDRLRIHLVDFYNKILGVCAGLWNFYIETN